MPQKERIIQGLGILSSEQTDVPSEELERMSAVLYILANKFLGSEDLKTVKERICMTRLGQMLVDDGIEIGIERGIAAMISDNMEEQVPETKIIAKLVKHFSLTEEAAKGYMEKYGKQTV